MIRKLGTPLVALGAMLATAPAARATISFDVAGLAGTGVTARVSFTYTSVDASNATLRFVIENTTPDSGTTEDARISAFAFNVPGGLTLTTIAGVTSGAGVIQLGPPPSQVIPENQPASFNEAGWYGLYASNDIKTPNSAGDFDFGIMNNNNALAFITDGAGSGPSILNDVDTNDSTAYILNVTGTGLNTGDAAIEQAIMSALSEPQQAGDPGYTFAVRFQGIGPNDDSDLATTIIPAPGAAALAALGLGLVGWINRRRK